MIIEGHELLVPGVLIWTLPASLPSMAKNVLGVLSPLAGALTASDTDESPSHMNRWGSPLSFRIHSPTRFPSSLTSWKPRAATTRPCASAGTGCSITMSAKLITAIVRPATRARRRLLQAFETSP